VTGPDSDKSDFLNLAGEVAIVTGAGAGIGRSAALALAAAGAKVVAIDLGGEATEALVSTIRNYGGEAIGLAADIADEMAAVAIVDAAMGKFGRIDILVNNAGIYPPGARLPELDWRLFERTFAVNVFGALRLSCVAANRMSAGGRIINMSSMESLRPSGPSTAHYSSSKAALNGITRACAVDFAPLGIRVNAILPGVVLTEGTAQMPEEFLKAFAARAPSGRVGTPDDVANAVLYLASKASGYVNGHCLVVDGGTTISG